MRFVIRDTLLFTIIAVKSITEIVNISRIFQENINKLLVSRNISFITLIKHLNI